MSDTPLDSTVLGYVTSLLDHSTPSGFLGDNAPGGEFGDFTYDILSEYNPDLLEPTIAKMCADPMFVTRCEKFISDHAATIERLINSGVYDGYHSIGHDLALTQLRLGAGFQDRGLGTDGDVLEAAAEELPYEFSIWAIPEGSTIAAATDIGYEHL